mgnify:CR=1 FL=1|tara:strand:+ start:269 stop:703 length:435 start_codon:yes stop_codon:yes gene_type:complete
MRLTILFILILFGCSSQPNEPNQIYDFELDLNLMQDENGYFHLPMDISGSFSNQVLHKFAVNTNNPNVQLVHWMSNTFYEMDYFGYTNLIPIINGSSYTYEDGMAYTMFGPHLEQVGDTIAVLVGYTDSHTFECYTLSFNIILD